MQGSFKLGRIAGISIEIHYTWLIVFALITWSLAVGFFPATFPGFDPTTYWIMGALSAILLFVAVLLHELSHSLVAIQRGLPVERITLFIFGGMAQIRSEAEHPRDEFFIAVVGPLTSFALAAIFWGILQLVPALLDQPAGAILAYLALVNLLLGGFNLLPAFPLDGGRVLRSILWATTNSLRKATTISSYVGQGFAFLFIFWGVSQIFAGAFLGGLWIAFIGWFLNSAAESTRQGQAMQENLRGIRVSQVMNPSVPTVSPDMTVEQFICEHALRRGHRAAIVSDDGRMHGIVTITDVKDVPRDRWTITRTGEILTARDAVKTVTPHTDLSEAMRQLAEGSLNQLPVVEGDRVVGILSRADVVRFLQLQDEFDLEVPRGRDGAAARAEEQRLRRDAA